MCYINIKKFSVILIEFLPEMTLFPAFLISFMKVEWAEVVVMLHLTAFEVQL